MANPGNTAVFCTIEARLLSPNNDFAKNLTDLSCIGGFASGEITELYGESGCGKTQVCPQLSVVAQVSLHVT